MIIRRTHLGGVIIGLLLIGISFLFFETKWFFFFIGVGVIFGLIPFVFSLIREAIISSEKEEMFLEFMRNLSESVNVGTPISKSIINVRNKPYGVLSKNVRKMANQISMGIPLSIALKTFSKDVNHKTISRALNLIGQAEKAGGDIGRILESVASAVSLSDKLRKERKAMISNLVVQGYIIFLIFIFIILIMQFKIIPMIAGVTSTGIGSMGEVSSPEDTFEITSSFIYLMLVQGFFTGLVVGKLAEGSVKKGIKHSFALMVLSFMISTIANLIFG